MNTLSNGAIAVGQEGSWMRFQVAYEFELNKMYERGVLRLKDVNETVSHRAETMMYALIEKRAIAGESMKLAAIACGVKGNETSIRQYLMQANPHR